MVEQTDQCTVLVHWSPPNNYDVNNIDSYIIRSSHGSNMEMRHTETSTLVGFFDSCSDDLHINITIVNRCGSRNSTADFKPNVVPTERQDVPSTSKCVCISNPTKSCTSIIMVSNIM